MRRHGILAKTYPQVSALLVLLFVLAAVPASVRSESLSQPSSIPEEPVTQSSVPAPPSVTTRAASEVGLSSATLNALLAGTGSANSVLVYFEFGVDSRYGAASERQVLVQPGPFSSVLRNLQPNTTYHYRAMALGSGVGWAYGEDASFTTAYPDGAGPGGPSGTTPESPFTLHRIDTAGDVGSATSIAFDPHGYPAISYWDSGNSDLKFARWTGAAWSIETVDATADVGLVTSLAFDLDGNPAIGYYDTTNQHLKLARRSGTGWTPQTVDSTGDTGGFASLAFDSQGNPSISYTHNENGDLRFARWNGTAWSIQDVDTTGGVGASTSLAYDLQGNPAIAYYDPTNGDLKLARSNGTTWALQTVGAAGDVGFSVSLAFDPQGYPAMSYCDATNIDLKLARWSGFGWKVETVDGEGEVGVASSLRFDLLGFPAIAYYDSTRHDLKFARSNGVGWSIWTLDSDGDVGASVSLAFDPLGNPAISYLDSVAFDLKLAYSFPPPAPVLVFPPAGGKVGAPPLLDWADVTYLPGVVYELQVDDEAGFVSPVMEKTGLPASAYTPSATEAIPEGTYFWRVRAVDPGRSIGPWSVSSFVVDTSSSNSGSGSATLTIVANGDGSTAPGVGYHAYPLGTVVDLLALPAPGWQFASWSNGVADSYLISTTITMDADKVIGAYFVRAPSAGRVVFSSSGGEPEGSIYIMNDDGSEKRYLTTGHTPSLSQDGTRIAFVFQGDIYVMNVDGSNHVNITNSPYRAEGPAWSPDGTKLAFSRSDDGVYRIYVMDADGRTVRRVTQGSDSKPAWSPDGSRIAFVRRSDALYPRDGRDSILVTELDGLAETLVTAEPGYIYRVSWSPNTRLLYDLIAPYDPRPGYPDYYSLGIYTIGADGSDKTPLPRTGALQNGSVPEWSADGTRIIFTTTRYLPIEIYTSNTDGSGQLRLTDNQVSEGRASWAFPKPAQFVASNLSVRPSEAKPGELVTISLSVSNTGGSQGNYIAELAINGAKEEERVVTLPVGTSKTVEFSIARDAVATYEVGVGSQSSRFAVMGPTAGGPGTEESVEVVPREEVGREGVTDNQGAGSQASLLLNRQSQTYLGKLALAGALGCLAALWLVARRLNARLEGRRQ